MLDIISVILPMVGFYYGYRNGFLGSVIVLIATIGATVLAMALQTRSLIFLYTIKRLPEGYISPLLYISLCLLILLVNGVISKLCSYMAPLNYIDKILGGIVGGIKLLFLLSVFILLAELMEIEVILQLISNSAIASTIRQFLFYFLAN